jgi:hypothetical protein
MGETKTISKIFSNILLEYLQGCALTDQKLIGANRKWDHRRIVWTRDQFYVTRINSLEAVEAIPLNEIQAVVEMNDEPDTVLKQPSFLTRPKNSVVENNEEPVEASRDSNAAEASLFSRNSTTNCVLQIKTMMDSVIAGRTLYLSTRHDHNSEQQRQAIVSTLSDAVAVARKKALVLSSFQKSQEKVRRVQGSLAFQMAMAALIILVSTRSAPARHDARGAPSHQTKPPHFNIVFFS